MAQIFIEPLARALTNTGAIGAGYKYYFYTTATTTPINSYTTPGLSVANPWPLVADSNGRFPIAWLANLGTSKSVLTDANDVVIETADPLASTAGISLNDLDVRPTSYWGLTTGTSTAYILTANPPIFAYSDVQTFIYQPHIANGTNPTMAISGLAAINLKKYTNQGSKVALQPGDTQAGQRYLTIIDGSEAVILNPRAIPMNSGVSAPLTIASGAITITNVGSTYTIDTEGGAGSDDLVTINGGTDGQIIFLNAASNSRRVVLKQQTSPTGDGEIYNQDLVDIPLLVSDLVMLRYNVAFNSWVVVSSSTLANFKNLKSAGGYTFLPNGWLFQCGLAVAGGGNKTLVLPIAFPGGFIFVTLINNNTTQHNDFETYINNLSSFDYESLVSASTDPRWFAIGY